MSDLISRSTLTKEIESLSMQITGLRAGKGVLQEFMNEYRKSVLRIIDEQPTAYDLDKVVAGLEKLNGYTIVETTLKKHEIIWNGECVPKDKVIQIIKAGVVK